MKLKHLVLTAFSLAGVALTAAPASAWWLFNKHCNRHSTVIVCRPYNAFSPVCHGSLTCDGCCPFSCAGLPGGAHCGPGLGNPMFALSHGSMNPYAMQPMMMPHPAMAMPQHMMPQQAMPHQHFQAPVPAAQQTRMPMAYPIHAAAYQHGYYPMYYPVQQQPVQQQAPAYWYGY